MIRVKQLSSLGKKPSSMIRQAIDKDVFRRACAKFATGIVVTTVIGKDGGPHGLTANSFTSVSLSPPLVLVCIDGASSVATHFRSSSYYGINILGEHQRHVSNRFCQKGQDRFAGVQWSRGKTGVPLLPGAIGALECAVTDKVEAGDHVILIGKVVQGVWHEGKPLVYFNSDYHHLV
jgi:flavin reductase (DIM6/NTAB) family NADH-FMN oxidoreductase RutF